MRVLVRVCAGRVRGQLGEPITTVSGRQRCFQFKSPVGRVTGVAFVALPNSILE